MMARIKDDDNLEKETGIEAMEEEAFEDDDKPGKPSAYACPDCGGVLRELEDSQRLRYRCRVGHAYGADGLMRTQADSLESALWSPFRVLQENAALARRLCERARQNQHDAAAEKFATKSRLAEEHARLIRELLLTGQIKAAEEQQQGS